MADNGNVATKSKGKRGRKTSSYRDTGLKNGSNSVWQGAVSLVKGSPKIPFQFNVPMSLAEAAKSPDAEKWYNMLVAGAFSTAARETRAKNDTTIKFKGKRIDALSLTRGKLARFLTSAYQAAQDLGKNIPEKVSAIAAKAQENKLVTMAVDGTGDDAVTIFKAVPEAEIAGKK